MAKKNNNQTVTNNQATNNQKTAPKQEAPKQEAAKIPAVKYVFGSVLQDGKEVQTCKAIAVQMTAPKCYVSSEDATATLQAFVYHDIKGRLDSAKTAASAVLSSEDAQEDAKEEARARLAVINAKLTALEGAAKKAKARRQLVKDAEKLFPVSRILASVLTGQKLPIEYAEATKALKACNKVYDAITSGTGRAMTAEEQATLTTCKKAIQDSIATLTAAAKDSKGFSVRLKNDDIRDLYKVSWKMSEVGNMKPQNKVLERNLMKQVYGKMLTEEQAAALTAAAKEAEKDAKNTAKDAKAAKAAAKNAAKEAAKSAEVGGLEPDND